MNGRTRVFNVMLFASLSKCTTSTIAPRNPAQLEMCCMTSVICFNTVAIKEIVTRTVTKVN